MLEYVNDNNNNIKASAKFILILTALLFIIFLIIGYIDKILQKEFFYLILYYFFGINFIALFFYLILFGINRYLKKANNKIMEIGEKKQGYIFSIGQMPYYKTGFILENYLLIKVDDKTYKIEHLVTNKASKLLEKYFINKNKESDFTNWKEYYTNSSENIPIDVYMYKNKIYANLKSVNIKQFLR